MSYKLYDFGVNLSNIPNFDVMQNTNTVDIPEEYLDRYAEYIKKIINTLDKDNITIVSIYGGETLQYFTKLRIFIEKLINHVDWFVMYSYGKYISENFSEILKLWNTLGYRFKIKLCGDIAINSDNTRLFWTTYRKLVARDLISGITIKINGNNIKNLSKFFDTYLEQQIYNDNLQLYLSLDESKYDQYSKEESEKIINSIVNKINSLSSTEPKIKYKSHIKVFDLNYKDTILGNRFPCLCGDGTVYPSYEIPAMSNYGLQKYSIGSIMDDIDTLVEKRSTLLNSEKIQLENLDEYRKLFLSVPFTELDENGVDKVNVQPFTKACELHDLLKNAFPEND